MGASAQYPSESIERIEVAGIRSSYKELLKGVDEIVKDFERWQTKHKLTIVYQQQVAGKLAIIIDNSVDSLNRLNDNYSDHILQLRQITQDNEQNVEISLEQISITENLQNIVDFSGITKSIVSCGYKGI